MRKMTALILSICLLLVGGNVNFEARENNIPTDCFVTEAEAYTVAMNFVISNYSKTINTEVDGDLYAHGITEIQSEGYPREFMILGINSFYDYYGDVSAYYVAITDINENPAGYVIISASKEEHPIIEYAYDGGFYLYDVNEVCDVSERNMSNAEPTIYYNGGLSYTVEIDEKLYYPSEVGLIEIDMENDIQAMEEKSNSQNELQLENIKTEWECLAVTPKARVVGGVIINPESYESGYQHKTSDYCYGMPSSFYKGTDLATREPSCAPVAGTNLCYYWINRDSIYSNVFNTANPNLTYSNVYVAMGTTLDGGTTTVQAQQGIRQHFINKGYNSTKSYYATCTTTDHFNNYIKAEINEGRAILVGLVGDAYYGNHMVLGVGYERYMYNGTWSSHYIRIVDGFTSTATRYVLYEAERTGLTRIRVIPGT